MAAAEASTNALTTSSGAFVTFDTTDGLTDGTWYVKVDDANNTSNFVVKNVVISCSISPNPFANNLVWGMVDTGVLSGEGQPIFVQGYKFTTSMTGITRITISAKAENSLGSVTYDQMQFAEYQIYDSNTADDPDNGVYFSLPALNQIRVFSGTHPEEQNIGTGAGKIGYRMTIYYSGGTWVTSATSDPADYIRQGGTQSGGD